ncbi:MAG: DoxX family protein [bacterium]|nr:DoxX family protein [bacterium]
MKSLIKKTSRLGYDRSFGLLIIRIAAGLVFFMHGWSKVNGLGGVEEMFMNLGLWAWVGVFIAWFEVVGGLALILGVATRVIGFLFAIEMLFAIFLTGFNSGYRSHELELLLMLISLGVAMSGSGRFSLFKLECEECGGLLCDEHGKR